jgi:23S rRNA pseudouridine1911/1915/1917 synthase
VDAVSPPVPADRPEVLYEDNHVIVAVKPPGVLSQPDGSPAPDMLALLKAYLKERYAKPGDVFLGLVHRLDRPVGGVMVFARTSKGASRLSAQIRDHGLEKRYLAVVHGRPLQEAGVLTARLQKDPRTNTVRRLDDGEDGQDGDPAANAPRDASLSYRTLASTPGPVTLLEIALETGRSHQIRAQLADAGLPILGDRRYGLATDDFETIALWAFHLGFDAPTRAERLVIQAPPPADEDPWRRFAAHLPARSVPDPRS